MTSPTNVIDAVLKHIKLVEKHSTTLGKYFILLGDVEFGLKIISNGRKHDLSKLTPFEFVNLSNSDTTDKGFQMALHHHQKNNEHHPEFWGDIHFMPNLYIAEMVCDWYARSNEFGTDLRKWIKSEATKKYNFKMTDPIGKQIETYLDILLVPPFKK